MTRFRVLLSLVIAFGGLEVAGCHRGMTIDQARRATVVTAAGAKLSGATVERWLLALDTRPQPASNVLISAWIDEALLATAHEKGAGVMLEDSATVDGAIYPDAARAVVAQFVADRAGRVKEATDAEVDSVIKLDQVRVFQQIGLMVPPHADSATVAAVYARAKALHVRAMQRTTDFTALVREASEDTATKGHDGFLPALGVQSFAPPLQRSLWALRPGDISGVARTPAGPYIVRRATAAESRDAVRRWFRLYTASTANASFLDSLLNERQIHVAPDAASRTRASLREPLPLPSGSSLAWWNGGTLPPDEVQLWISSFAAVNRMSLAVSSDSALTAFVTELAKHAVVLGVVAPHGSVTPEIRKSLGSQYRAALDLAWAQLQQLGGNGTPEQRASAAVDSMVMGKIGLHTLPGRLGGILRAKLPVTVNSAAIDMLIQGAASAWRPPAVRDSLAAVAKGRGSH